MSVFGTVCVANRGEIAVRIMRTLRTLGIRSVAVYSDADRDAVHVRAADDAVRIGPAEAAHSYLDRAAVIDAARRSGAQAIHPGYGFLAENAAFARDCRSAGLTFIGPAPEVIETMGDKIAAKRTVEAAGVPVVPGVHRTGMDDPALIEAAGSVGYPLMVKAAAGGGGKGMRVVTDHDGLAEALTAARREAAAAFGDDDLLLERYVTVPRHVEIQVLADTHGRIVHLGERECSLQRRHQKVIEECPSPLLDVATRTSMGAAAVAVARACGYVGAGTVEFIVPGHDPGAFCFLEMNTRLQVEHPVTEAVYDVDLVALQLAVAAGEPLPFAQDDLRPDGHAAEARVYAEDPRHGFLPTGGTISGLVWPAAPARVDGGVASGTEVSSHYDPMLAKIVVHAADRTAALRGLAAALDRTVVHGVTTNIGFLGDLLRRPEVRDGQLDTGLIDRIVPGMGVREIPDEVVAAAALDWLVRAEPSGGHGDPFDQPGGWRIGVHAWTPWRARWDGGEVEIAVRGRATDAEVRIGGREPRRARAELAAGGSVTCWLDGVRMSARVTTGDGSTWVTVRGLGTWELVERARLEVASTADPVRADGPLTSPMPGTVVAVRAEPGQHVTSGQTLVIVEAMKMEHPVTATAAGTVTAIHVRPGQSVAMAAVLAEIDADDRAPGEST